MTRSDQRGPPRSRGEATPRPDRIPPVRTAVAHRRERRSARAIRCGQAILDATGALGIELRVGLHTGECEVRGDHLGGLAVHIAARVGALAAPRQVLVSTTVKDLVVGSGIEFTDRGEHELKGVPGTWKLFSVKG